MTNLEIPVFPSERTDREGQRARRTIVASNKHNWTTYQYASTLHFD